MHRVYGRLCVTIKPMKRSLFILFALSLLALAPAVYAQYSTDQTGLEINFYPENPAPNQTITVSVASYTTDINSANIVWTIDGKVFKSGKGVRTIEFTTGDSGKTTTLKVSVTTKEGEVITNTIPIRPISVDLIWQSESYTPPFYRGKALFSPQDTITFIAVPHIPSSNGSEISPKNLIYTWSKNGSVMESDSGYGKNTYTFTQSVIARAMDISVKVTSSNTNDVGFKLITIAPTEPAVMLYKKSPLYGIEFQKTLVGDIDLNDSKEIDVLAVPFFFGTTNPAQWLTYKWNINGAKIDNDTSQTSRVFRQPEGVSGISNIAVSLVHSKKILQQAGAGFGLKYNTKPAEEAAF